MAKMKWDRVEQERRASKLGYEWVNSVNSAPPSSTPPNNPKPLRAAMELNKEARPSKEIAAQPSILGTALHNIAKPVIVEQSRSFKASTAAIGQPQSQPQSKRAISGESMVAAKPSSHTAAALQTMNSQQMLSLNPKAKAPQSTPLSVPEMQKLSIRLYKAIGANQLVQAASIASDLFGEIMNHAAHGSERREL